MDTADSSGLEVIVGQRLQARGLTLALAESCTGGLIRHRITNVAGSSAYYRGGVVAYANAVKQALLGVRAESLAQHGAVSAVVAREMACGVRRLLEADIGVSVTGVAGPGGGTPEKPVGLTFVGLSAADGDWVERHCWEGNRREENKARSAQAALDLLWRYLEGRLEELARWTGG